MKSEIKQRIDEFLEKIKKSKYFGKIEFIFQYGSSIGDYILEDSDIDICIHIEDNQNKLTNIRFNLLKEFNEFYDIQIFEILPIYIQIDVIKSKLLYFKGMS